MLSFLLGVCVAVLAVKNWDLLVWCYEAALGSFEREDPSFNEAYVDSALKVTKYNRDYAWRDCIENHAYRSPDGASLIIPHPEPGYDNLCVELGQVEREGTAPADEKIPLQFDEPRFVSVGKLKNCARCGADTFATIMGECHTCLLREHGISEFNDIKAVIEAMTQTQRGDVRKPVLLEQMGVEDILTERNNVMALDNKRTWQPILIPDHLVSETGENQLAKDVWAANRDGKPMTRAEVDERATPGDLIPTSIFLMIADDHVETPEPLVWDFPDGRTVSTNDLLMRVSHLNAPITRAHIIAVIRPGENFIGGAIDAALHLHNQKFEETAATDSMSPTTGVQNG